MVVAVVVLLLLVGLLAWRMGWLTGDDAGKAGQAAMPPVPVEVSTVLKKTVLDQLSVTGSFMAVESVDLRPEVAGRIAEIRFRDGQQVDRGMLLIRLDDSVVKAELAQAQAEAELALSNYRRAQDLFSRNFISSRALDEARPILRSLRPSATSSRPDSNAPKSLRHSQAGWAFASTAPATM